MDEVKLNADSQQDESKKRKPSESPINDESKKSSKGKKKKKAKKGKKNGAKKAEETLVYFGAGWHMDIIAYMKAITNVNHFLFVDGLPDHKHYTERQAGYVKCKDRATFLRTLRAKLVHNGIVKEDTSTDCLQWVFKDGRTLHYYINITFEIFLEKHGHLLKEVKYYCEHGSCPPRSIFEFMPECSWELAIDKSEFADCDDNDDDDDRMHPYRWSWKLYDRKWRRLNLEEPDSPIKVGPVNLAELGY